MPILTNGNKDNVCCEVISCMQILYVYFFYMKLVAFSTPWGNILSPLSTFTEWQWVDKSLICHVVQKVIKALACLIHLTGWYSYWAVSISYYCAWCELISHFLWYVTDASTGGQVQNAPWKNLLIGVSSSNGVKSPEISPCQPLPGPRQLSWYPLVLVKSPKPTWRESTVSTASHPATTNQTHHPHRAWQIISYS